MPGKSLYKKDIITIQEKSLLLSNEDFYEPNWRIDVIWSYIRLSIDPILSLITIDNLIVLLRLPCINGSAPIQGQGFQLRYNKQKSKINLSRPGLSSRSTSQDIRQVALPVVDLLNAIG